MDSSGIASIFNYRAADDTIATAGQPTETQFQAIARSGFEVVINLALHDDPRYSLPDEAGLVNSLRMEYVHIPVQFGAPAEEDLLAFFSVMEKNRAGNCSFTARPTSALRLHRLVQGR